LLVLVELTSLLPRRQTNRPQTLSRGHNFPEAISLSFLPGVVFQNFPPKG